VDCGTSGGVWGLDRGYSLMIGGDDDAVSRLEPIFAALAPGVDAAPRTPGREGDLAPGEAGYLHCGPSGAGHFVKMVHNGIEYGMMAAYAEGLNVLKNANIGAKQAEVDAETAPLDHPEAYRYDIDIARSGAVAASSPRGSSTSPRPRSPTRPTSTSTRAASPTRARAAGPRSPRSRRACRLRC
jgi:6-phosphogluconate dehydrogenase